MHILSFVFYLDKLLIVLLIIFWPFRMVTTLASNLSVTDKCLFAQPYDDGTLLAFGKVLSEKQKKDQKIKERKDEKPAETDGQKKKIAPSKKTTKKKRDDSEKKD